MSLAGRISKAHRSLNRVSTLSSVMWTGVKYDHLVDSANVRRMVVQTAVSQ